MRTLTRVLASPIAAAALLSIASFASVAEAQLDINPPLPNVLLVIDTSGSMENMASGKRPEEAGATCVPGTATPLNRWATLVTVLTGTIQNFSCFAQDRSSTSFLNEFTLPSGPDPYDYKYYLPFHRILSNGCAYGPGSMGGSWWDWPANALKTHAWNNTSQACAAPGFQQANDGLLDTYRDRVRFGLMTFDTLPDPGTGASGSVPTPNDGTKGMWSYYPNWSSGGSPANGNPPNCATHDFEVGGRNPAAPPWEGRLLGFGPHDAPIAQVQQTNDRIQSSLLAMRPYGATPIAGILADARDYLLNDGSNDPATGKPFGPKNDPYYAGKCRDQFVILLSDGEPNLDLRESCATGNGKCPYARPHEIAHQLVTQSHPIKTFAIGFGLSQAGGTDCSALTQSDIVSPGGLCSNATGTLKACCTLSRIAYEGGTKRAFFANDLPSLKSALDQVLAVVSAGSTSRTIPVFSTAGATTSQGNASAAGYQFVTSFDAPVGSLWTGNLERKRYVCENQGGVLKPVLASIEQAKGDDFEANLNSNTPSRKFFTLVGPQANGQVYSRRSLRPSVTTDDGLGLYGGTTTGLLDGALFASTLAQTPLALDIPSSPVPDSCKAIAGSGANANTCADTVVRWEVGMPGVPQSRYGNGFGSIYHASPVTMGAPNEFLRDESYAAFAADPEYKKRPLVLFAATTDGQLHAFKVASNDSADAQRVDTLENNELWSFLPPHVLPGLLPTYGRQAFLLDGSPVVKDVIFERTRAQAQAGAAGSKWRSVLIAAGGLGGSFYYALDVTKPSDPKFLWQLSTNTNGEPLFGATTIKPAITTIAVDNGSGDVKEVAVAILPGGTTTLTTGSCPRLKTSTTVASSDAYQPKTSGDVVRCWHDASGRVGAARSLSVVRLDTGELLMNFRGKADDGPVLPSAKVKENAFDSPVTGVPVPYPSLPGQVSDRIYVGDADGTLYRINLASPKPDKWTVDLAWDAYAFGSDTAATRQPIETPPIVTVDPIGNPVVLLSTGDQETFTSSAGVQTRAWSIREEPNGAGTFVTKSNWVIPFENGVRVTGPISLFNGVAYFSTFTPTGAQGNACADGYGAVWGVDYYRKTACSANGPTPPADWPCPRYVQDPVNAAQTVSFFENQQPGTVVFGVAVTQTPSCYEQLDFADPAFGAMSTVSNSTAGEFQLVFQTGQGGTSADNSKTNTVTKRLPPPRTSVRIDSWGLVLE
ncbi:PilC/PilY family type IV pilus protein [Polyangium sorediatum]|uniref:PilC/PilY family type IV pilus protein n=1 Tax=Polyangium sorediatum TaxID=889274 RepID=A0ABT6NT05_9BACT|nr:PilC/PilY family type IV pilus protein [Polyangium sorediatum]MDI1431282.1 PilC/PilY family type IV pilus protein [Polyangium sorediatum]